MAHQHTRRCSTSLIVREMQIKTTRRYPLTLVRKAIIKKLANNKFWRGCEKREPSYTIGGNVNWCRPRVKCHRERLPSLAGGCCTWKLGCHSGFWERFEEVVGPVCGKNGQWGRNTAKSWRGIKNYRSSGTAADCRHHHTRNSLNPNLGMLRCLLP